MPQGHGMLTMPMAEGASGTAAGGARNAQGAFQAGKDRPWLCLLPPLLPLLPPSVVSAALFSRGWDLLPASASLSKHLVTQQLGLGMQLAYLILTIFLGQLLVDAVRAQVHQEPFMETTEGTGINIICSHTKIQTGDWIQWYRLLPGQGPELLVLTMKESKELPNGAGSLSVSADRRSSWLWLAEPRRGDAAVYYCALGVSGSGYKLTFGSGTRLSIQPKVTPSPSVYRLTSKDAQGLEMCLITDYSPEKLNVSSAEQRTSAVVGVTTDGDSEESSYLSTYWATSDRLHCAASHEGFGELEGEDPESGASAVCVTGLSLHFRTDEHLNTISLSQLGLKIVLMKGIIFNVLMTVLVWKKKKD